jgi:hypothetical protein
MSKGFVYSKPTLFDYPSGGREQLRPLSCYCPKIVQDIRISVVFFIHRDPRLGCSEFSVDSVEVSIDQGDVAFAEEWQTYSTNWMRKPERETERQ